ncbi:MAG: competence/damage-inducible protein A [Alphaproteobacteria bacterium]|nr:competence/damage-inducible protein A [Alphaproteobacteria bacterium]
MTNPTAAVLVIGNEVLSGRIADVNVNYICRRGADVGLDVAEVRMVCDHEAAIVAAANALRQAYTYVFTTGGIGPTHDDITIASIAKAFGVAVQRNLQIEQQLRDHYGSRVTPAALRMADYPAGARIVPHGESFAPSCLMENVAILAGQPRIMQLMFEATLPLLQTGTPLHTRQLDVWGMESQIAERLGALQSRFPTVDIGSYPYRVDGRPGTALVCRGAEAGEVEASFAAVQALVAEAGLDVRG